MSSFTGNWFALLAFAGWPLIALALYKALPFSRATVWTILGGYLLLPTDVALKFAMIPAFDKNTIPNICAGIGCILCSRKRPRSKFSKLAIGIVVVFLLSPFVTSTLNNDPVFIGGGKILPGVGYYDAISELIYQSIFFLPFLLGWRYMRNVEDIITVFSAMAIAGLFYSLPMLFEMRFSPQLSFWVYGFFPSSFPTEVRYGGYRPVVFFVNGLALAFFLMTTVMATLAIWRNRTMKVLKLPLRAASTYLAMVIVLTKSAGALLYAIVAGPLICFAKPRTLMRISLILVAVALAYPLLRAENVFPTQTMLNIASTFSEERASSLETRFDQEDQLLARASERRLFGWGRYGRSRIYAEDSGKDISLTDGLWVITMGSFGMVGFFAFFGLLCLPVFKAMSSFRYIGSEPEQILISSLALIIALTIVEQLPNSSISPWSWLLAGVLLGRAEELRSPQRTRPDPAIFSLSMQSTRNAYRLK